MQILQLGSRGPDVLRLQQQLNRLVAPGPRLVEDGVYGPGTVNAVMQFQRSKRLFPDGKAGPNTMAALTGNNSPSAQPTVGTSFNPSGKTFSQRLEAFLS